MNIEEVIVNKNTFRVIPISQFPLADTIPTSETPEKLHPALFMTEADLETRKKERKAFEQFYGIKDKYSINN
jgi:hypothetical protein